MPNRPKLASTLKKSANTDRQLLFLGSKIHHAAFDAHLIGIDPDFRVHVAERLLLQNDGPILEALKRLHLSSIHLPARGRDHPDRDRLAQRFESFKAAA